MAAYREGDAVVVKKLKQVGLVREALSNHRYKVAIGSLSLTCHEDELEPGRAPSVLSPKPRNLRTQTKARPPECLDLHGQKVVDALHMLEEWLSDVVLSDLTHVKVIHGLGTGRVQDAVHRRLQELKAVRHFKVNEFNPGETDIYL